MSSYIQVPYGFRKVSNPIQFSVPKIFEENQYLSRIGYISNKDDPVVKIVFWMLQKIEKIYKNGFWQLVILVMNCNKMLTQ